MRLAVGLSGLQGPAREKEKREKERSELRDLVIPEACYWFASLQWGCLNDEMLIEGFSCFFVLDTLLGWKESSCSQSDRGC